MRKVSFRVRNFEKEQFLTYNISNEANLDEDILDFLEDEEPVGVVPVIFEEQEEFDTFSYNITGKIHLSELSNQEINSELVLLVLRGVILSLIDMQEYRIPFSYLVLNREYVYVDSEYKIEFICIPLEEMKGEADIIGFLRNLLANLRYDPNENGDYVARLLSYVNNTACFNLRNMEALVEELMEKMDVTSEDDASAEIYAEYQEVDESAQPKAEEITKEAEPVEAETEKEVAEEGKPVEESAPAEDIKPKEKLTLSGEQSKLVKPAEEPVGETVVANNETKSVLKTKKIDDSIVMEDELDDYLAEKELAEKFAENLEDSNIKIKNVKVSRASVVKNAKDDYNFDNDNDDEAISNSILGQTLAMTGILGSSSAPRINPYLIRVNTEEKIIVSKQGFKIGKANMGVDYSVKGNGAVSRIHATIINKDGVYYIKDNKSTNHTYVNGRIVQDGEAELLTHDCKIILGDEEFIFKLR